ncbi:MAG: WD40/YVTN/BNR-like repeat-containing protein, partial [Acidobacteriota bacterium]
ALEIAHRAGGLVLAATDRGLYLARPESLGTPDASAKPFDGEANPGWKPVWRGGELDALAVEGDQYLAIGPRRVVRGSLGGRLAAVAPSTAGPPAMEPLVAEGLPSRVAAIALDHRDPRVAYAVAGHRVFRSGDGGAHWQSLPLPWPAADLRAVALDPSNPDQVLALDYRGALYRGHGNGQYWLILDQDRDLQRAWKLRVSPQAPGLALVATQGQGLRVVTLNPGDGGARATGATSSRSRER